MASIPVLKSEEETDPLKTESGVDITEEPLEDALEAEETTPIVTQATDLRIRQDLFSAATQSEAENLESLENFDSLESHENSKS